VPRHDEAPDPVKALVRLSCAALVGAALAAPVTAHAQMPSDIAEKIAAMGRVVDPENTGKLYAPLQAKEPYGGVKVSRDVKYGSDPRNVVDIFVPEGGGTARPVLMFVHGGGMIRGNKRPPGSAFYDNVVCLPLATAWSASTSSTGWRRSFRGRPATRTLPRRCNSLPRRPRNSAPTRTAST
jgi:triacylglycerol lipase